MHTSSKPYLVKRTHTGLGLVANQTFKKGDCIIEFTGERISNDEADRRDNRYLVDISDTKTLDISGYKNLARYINHGCKPNCIVEVDEDERVHAYAKKTIRPGDELTFNYGKEYFNRFIKPHGCKCAACRST